MAGQLTIDTLKASSGVLATQNGMTGVGKAWVNYNGVTQTVVNSFNVSSVTRSGTGSYTVNFTTAMPNANYVANVGLAYSGYLLGSAEIGSSVRTTTALSIVCCSYVAAGGDNRSVQDNSAVQLSVFSS
jgi:hypothetical protein